MHAGSNKRPAPVAHDAERPACRRRVQFIIDDEIGTPTAGVRTEPRQQRAPPALSTGPVQTRIVLRQAPSSVSPPTSATMPKATATAMTPTTTTVNAAVLKPARIAVVVAAPPKTNVEAAAKTAGSPSSAALPDTRAPAPMPLLPEPKPAARTAILGAHYTVSKAGLTDANFEAHRRWLTIEPPPNQYRAAPNRGGRGRGGGPRSRRAATSTGLSTRHVDDDTGTETVRLYREDERTFTVPRYYGTARWGMPPPERDRRARGTPTHVPFIGVLTPEQTEVCRRALVQFGIDPATAAARLAQSPQMMAQAANSMALATSVVPPRPSLAVTLASKASARRQTTAKGAHAITSLRPARAIPMSNASMASLTMGDGATAAAAERARMTRTPGASIKCPCGFGKTVCGIYIMCMTGRKAIFTVAQEEHMDKTEEEIRRFAPTARVGRIHRDRADVGDDYDIVLAMVQTLLARRYEPEMFDSFGLWVADEMHHMAAPAFSQVSSALRCYYTLGLSATPRRKDGLTPALFWTFGPMVANVRRVWDGVVCRMVRYAKGDQEEITMRNGKPNVPLMINRLATDPVRNYYAARAIVDCVVNPQPLPARRKVIVLSDRREQLSLLRELVIEAMLRHLTGEDVVVAGAPLDAASSVSSSSPSPSSSTTSETLCDARGGDETARIARDLLMVDEESETNRTLILSMLPARSSTRPNSDPRASAASRPSVSLPKGWTPRSATALVQPPTDPNALPGHEGTPRTNALGTDAPDDDNERGEVLFSIGFFVGGMKRHEREQGKRCDVILATYAEAGEGMDIPQLDTVVMVSPRSDVEQATGRALRTHPAKNEPLFIYFVDDFSLFRNQGWSVHRYLSGEGYQVRWETLA
ncbi:DEAD-like helicase domain containing protein [Pandoravirus neocaledonia]|uniref:DEAD-like helicase domain containing protein n=1 Tax=Pandoravirus neocaledonia TaxID=2107708 RepID=A0A2U7UBI2_9VIRU|nr:DEAD-like helicase domain containing protein [Pandoravirus neocaledonia]AVK75828.1 DEAD-like helicase domain containing protein [Pandoravirus neocaledonia]